MGVTAIGLGLVLGSAAAASADDGRAVTPPSHSQGGLLPGGSGGGNLLGSLLPTSGKGGLLSNLSGLLPLGLLGGH